MKHCDGKTFFTCKIRDSVIFVSVSALFTYIEYFHHPSCIQSFLLQLSSVCQAFGIAQHKIIMVFVLIDLESTGVH